MSTRVATSLILALGLLGIASPASTTDTLLGRLRTFVDSGNDARLGRVLHAPRQVAAFYKARGARPVWIGSDGALNEAAESLLLMARESWQEGLVPTEYHTEQFDRLLPVTPPASDVLGAATDAYSDPLTGESETEPKKPLDDLERQFSLELLLTDAWFLMADHLFAGRLDPSKIDADWAVRRRRLEPGKSLTEALETGYPVQFLRKLAPQDRRYLRLKLALSAYRSFEPKGPFPVVPEGPTLRRGSRDPRVKALRARLAREGYLKDAPAGATFDVSVEKALKAFQESRGLPAKGAADAATVTALNIPLSLLLRQVEATLERLRWLPRKLGERYVFVDIATFKLELFDKGEPALRMRIIVGDEYRRTPLLITKATAVIVNPYWTIPRSILAEEILPVARKDPDYLASHDIRVYEDTEGARREIPASAIDWGRIRRDGSPYLFRAHSGPKNPLGGVKVVLRNDFSVYLHGTPNAKLFQRERRTLSHGCIRVENPIGLAARLLQGSEPPWPRPEIKRAVADGLELQIPLPESMPVYLWYQSAWVDEKGRAHFHPDVYQWDEVLGNALLGKSPVVTKEQQLVIRGRAGKSARKRKPDSIRRGRGLRARAR